MGTGNAQGGRSVWRGYTGGIVRRGVRSLAVCLHPCTSKARWLLSHQINRNDALQDAQPTSESSMDVVTMNAVPYDLTMFAHVCVGLRIHRRTGKGHDEQVEWGQGRFHEPSRLHDKYVAGLSLQVVPICAPHAAAETPPETRLTTSTDLSGHGRETRITSKRRLPSRFLAPPRS